ncbi:class I SAM-dependent DNA methyltransferase [Ancylobacter mangrovi]|uniref:class I SAM-dependent DNA methyltransferase n=1 Tax=Ancylobacter mangrovi TaxID=2972472 RepID=UPI0021613A90|nr:nodulation S family protein [Ancylobacter mangrovi]MCS0501256.1 nodulation S family protein [Ancylobacter mangrovi]
MSASLPPTYFDALYQRSPDPWSFETSAYERAKYAATLDALPRPRYRRALEVGCSIGVLTHGLAARCDELIAIDPAPLALERARARCAGLAQVRFMEGYAPRDWADGRFDLIVLSEVVYYLGPEDVARLAARVTGALAPAGHVELVHWLGETDYPLTGDAAAELFIRETDGALRVHTQQRTGDYRLDLLVAR